MVPQNSNMYNIIISFQCIIFVHNMHVYHILWLTRINVHASVGISSHGDAYINAVV